MSGLALQYPLKEISLSDDLESFVHIIKWFALRYHQHSVRDTIRDNVENSSTEHICLILSLHMQATYFQDVLSRGFHIGGAAKIDSFKRKEPEFELDPDQASPAFDKLVRELHALCFEHYQLVNWAELDRLHDAASPSTKTKAPSEKPSFVKRQSVAFLPVRAQRQTRISPAGLGRGSEAVQRPAEDPLASHGAMVGVFRECLENESWFAADKTFDQFENLLEIHFLPPLSFHCTRSLNNQTTCEKRKSAKDASQSGNSKRLKPTTRSLPSHHEEDAKEEIASEENDA